MRVWPFLIILIVPSSAIAGLFMGGIYTFLTPFIIFGMLPICDHIIGDDTYNPSLDQERQWEADYSYRWVTMLCVPIQVATVCFACYLIRTRSLTVIEWIGFTVSIGMSSGALGINVSHELGHRVNEKLEPILSRIMLFSTLYMHWIIEHVAGHHRNVATLNDPATARLGESFYQFWPRTIITGFVSAWHIETKRINRLDPPWGILHHRVFRYSVLQLALVLAIGIVLGVKVMVFFLAQSFVSVSLLELVNYIEHYGLLRKKRKDNRYESVKPHHSWNSSKWLTNRFLFNLQRHSDHHYKPNRRYQILRHFNNSPQLPTGYAGMILLAMFPPIWRSIMDPKVRNMRTDTRYEI